MTEEKEISYKKGVLIIIVVILIFCAVWVTIEKFNDKNPTTEEGYCNLNYTDFTRCKCKLWELPDQNSTRVYTKNLECKEYRPYFLTELTFKQLEERYDCLEAYSCRTRFPEIEQSDVLYIMVKKQQLSLEWIHNRTKILEGIE